MSTSADVMPQANQNSVFVHCCRRGAGRYAIWWRRLVAVAWLMVSVHGAALAQTPPFAIRSIAFPLIGSNYLDDNPGWPTVATAIQEMKALGANDVKITISAGVYSSPLANLPSTTVTHNPSDAQLLALFQQIKAAGMQITLLPFVAIEFDPNGNLLDTVHAQPADFNVWMAAHTAIMVRTAQLAQQAGVDRIGILSDAVQQLAYPSANTTSWLSMISQVRAVYSGHLTSLVYGDGTVFSGGADHIGLFPRALIDALDSIGIGWFPVLTTNTRPSLAQLVGAWRNTVGGFDTIAYLRNLNTKYNKPVWISDLAFHSFVGATVSSGDIYNVNIPLVADQQLQADQYDSLFTVLSLNTGPWFLGVSCDSWNRFPSETPGIHRFLNSAYGENLRGKLAATTLQQWFSGQRGWGGMQSSATAEGVNTNLVLTGNLVVSPADLGKTGNVYVAAVLPNGSLALLSNGNWTLYSGGDIPVFSSGQLGSHSLPIITNTDVSALAGTTIVVGYGLDQNDLLANRKFGAVYSIR